MTARAEAVCLGTAAAAPAISAARVVSHPPEVVFAFLADLDRHWRLTDRYLRLIDVAPGARAGRIAIRSPIGGQRIASTQVTTVAEPRRFGGHARVGDRTCAHVLWKIEPHEDGACVELEATVLEASLADRLLLGVGGRLWLRRCFHQVLGRLADELAGV